MTENTTTALRSSGQEPVTVVGSGPSPVDQTMRGNSRPESSADGLGGPGQEVRSDYGDGEGGVA